MPKFKIHTPVKVEHIEDKLGIMHRIVSAYGLILFHQITHEKDSHINVTSLFDQTAAAINHKYHRVEA